MTASIQQLCPHAVMIYVDTKITKDTEHGADSFSHPQLQLFPVWAADEIFSHALNVV